MGRIFSSGNATRSTRPGRVPSRSSAAQVVGSLAVGSLAVGSLAVTALAVQVGAERGAAGASTTPPAPTTLPTGGVLHSGQALESANGAFSLTVKHDGDVVLSWFGRPRWSTGTAGHPGDELVMQPDGNLVLYAGTTPLWASGTSGSGLHLSVLRKGNAVVADAAGRVRWASGSAPRGTEVAMSARPTFDGDGPDSDVVRAGGTYYAFTTGTALGNYIQVLVDTSGSPLRGWRSYTGQPYGSSALLTLPSWEEDNSPTSPGVIHYGGHWLMFYDASEAPYPAFSGHTCLSVATAASLTPSHPVFQDDSAGPLYCGADSAIDPSPFVDPRTGAAYLVWESNDGSYTTASQVWVAQLDGSGTRFASAPQVLLSMDPLRYPWLNAFDDPQLLSTPHGYRLLFTNGNWQSSTYAEALATCSGPLGPCTPPAEGPFLRSHASVAGPGGGTFFQDGRGNWFLNYSAWSSGCTSYACGGERRLFVAPAHVG